MTKGGIYQIRNLINGKIYIGSTTDFAARWDRHKKTALGEYHKNKHLQSAILKYGIENFIFEILEYVKDAADKNILFSREQFYLDTLNPCDNTIGYNKATNAGGGRLVPIGYFAGDKNPMFGKSSKDMMIAKYGIEKTELLWSEMNKARSVNGINKGVKPVIQLDLSANIIAEHISITAAAKFTKIHLTGIHQVCIGKRKTAGGFKWKYKTN
jgi:group I intron endonuclease